jgi:hypothetical protein
MISCMRRQYIIIIYEIFLSHVQIHILCVMYIAVFMVMKDSVLI